MSVLLATPGFVCFGEFQDRMFRTHRYYSYENGGVWDIWLDTLAWLRFLRQSIELRFRTLNRNVPTPSILSRNELLMPSNADHLFYLWDVYGSVTSALSWYSSNQPFHRSGRRQGEWHKTPLTMRRLFYRCVSDVLTSLTTGCINARLPTSLTTELNWNKPWDAELFEWELCEMSVELASLPGCSHTFGVCKSNQWAVPGLSSDTYDNCNNVLIRPVQSDVDVAAALSQLRPIIKPHPQAPAAAGPSLVYPPDIDLEDSDLDLDCLMEFFAGMDGEIIEMDSPLKLKML
jgi:hypothetical protein